MLKTCKGCGIKIQDKNPLLEGYTISLEKKICERCFRIKNYGEFIDTVKSNEDFVEILKSISKTKDLVLYIVDIQNIDKDLSFIRKYLQNDIILVLNKRDILPKSINDEKILDYLLMNNQMTFLDTVIISTKNNYHMDLLLKKINKYKNSKKVYVVGHTNAGKSSLINNLIKNYSSSDEELTISQFQSTTLNKIEIEINKNLTIIDTPGLIDKNNINNYLSLNQIKKVISKKEIKPKTYQLSKNTSLLIDDILRIDYLEGDRNSFTFYISNNSKIKKINPKKSNLKDLSKTDLQTFYNCDVVINGLGFIKIVAPATLSIYVYKDVEVFTRKSLI